VKQAQNTADWRNVKLKEVCHEITVGHVGPMVSEYVDQGIPFLRSQNIEPFRLNRSDIKFISNEFHAKLKKSALRPGDVVVVRTGYPGTASVIPIYLPVANCADLVILRPSHEMNARFLVSIFNSTWGRGTVAGNLVGVAQQHFNIGAAKEMVIRLPSITSQQKIVAILSAYDDLIENNLRRIKILEEMAQNLYREWFVKLRFPGHQHVRFTDSPLGRIPEGWVVMPLGKLVELRKDKFNEKLHSGCPLLDLAKMQSRTLFVGDTGSPDELTTSRIIFEEGDILFGSIRPYLHKVALAPCCGVTNVSVLVIRPAEKSLQSFLAVLLSSIDTIRWADQHSTGTKMPVIKWEAFKAMPVPMPSQPVLCAFEASVQPMLQAIKMASSRNQNLRHTRDLLLPRLISGELDVSALDITAPEEASA